MNEPNIPVQALAEALSPPTGNSDRKVTQVTLTPQDDQNILDLMSYHRQRHISRPHVGNLADSMINGEFVPARLITFAPDHNGQHVLVDGQHRLQAAVDAHWTGEWVICALWGEHNNARDVYLRLDTSQKERAPKVIGIAVGHDHLSRRIQEVMVATARYQNLWRESYRNPPFCHVPPPRDNLERLEDRMHAFEQVNEIFDDKRVKAHTRRRLSSPMVLAVITETLHTSPDDASIFWRQAATDGTDIAGTLRELIIVSRPAHITSPHYAPRLAAQAWNQRQASRLRQTHKNGVKIATTDLEIPQ